MATISSLGIGSGLDLNGLLDQLNAAERGKLAPIKRQQQSHQAKISAYGKLQSALNKLQESAAKLNDPKFFQSVSSNVTGSGVKAAASGEAQPGRFDVKVQSLARAQSLATGGFAEAARFDAGSLKIELGGRDTPLDIKIAANSSLKDIRDQINAAKGASAPPSSTMAARSILPVGADQHQDRYRSRRDRHALRAGGRWYRCTLRLRAAYARRRGRRIPGGICRPAPDRCRRQCQPAGERYRHRQPDQSRGRRHPGVTLDLEEVTGDGSKTTVVVERNTLAIREAVGGFVKAYNDLRKTVGELTMFNADTGAAGELLGDGALRTVESRLRGVLSGGVGEGQFRMLSDIGISLQRDGTLKLDEQKMSGIVASDPQALSAFFAGEDKSGGLAGRLGDTLDQVLRDRGLLDNAKRGLESRISGLKDRYERMERSIEQTIQRYRVQFGQLDAMIANMNQVSDYLFQQFDIMNAQLGRKK